MSRGAIIWSIFTLQLLVFLYNLADAKGPTCLNCRHVIGPRHCHSVTVCREDEMCVTHMYTSSNGEKLFDVGCYSKHSCPQLSMSSGTTQGDTPSPYLCTQCCHGDLCNEKGCGESGYPRDRGAICLSCPQSRNASLCDMIAVCTIDEMCHIQEINEFDETYFVTKCAAKSVCNSHLSAGTGFGRRNIGSKRSSVRCTSCCSGDLCNYRCSHGNGHTTGTSQNTVSMTYPPTLTSLTSGSLSPISHSTSPVKTSNTHMTQTTPTSPVTSSTPTHPGHYGTDFILVFPHIHRFIDKVQLIITAIKDTVVSLESVHPGINRTISVSSSIGAIIELPNSVQLVGSAIQPKGIYIKSQNDIAVFGVEHSTLVKEVEGFYVLPMHKLGMFYMANSHYKFNVAVVAAEDNTCISFTNGYYADITYSSRSYRYNETFSVCINKFESLQLRATHYIMGFKIQSDKKIGVLSFDEFSGATGGADNIYLEYLPPVSDFGTTFIIPSFFKSNNNTKLIYAYSTQYTPLTFIWQLYKIFPTKRVYHSWFRINNTAYAFESSEHILLMAYSDNGKLHIKPFMTQIPAISQYSNNYRIRAPSTDTFENYICAIILSIHANELLIDGQSLVERSRTRETITVHLQDYDVMNVNITNGHHVVSHPDTNVMFGLISYGYSTEGGGSYAFPAGL